jgi:hypothetical protein
MGKPNKPKKVVDVSVNPDHENDYATLLDDVLGAVGGIAVESDSDEDYEDKKGSKNNRRRRDEGDEPPPPFMLFDFRRGPGAGPSGAELVDPKRCEELLEKATTAAEAAVKTKKKDGEEVDGGGGKKDGGTGTGTASSYSGGGGGGWGATETAVDKSDEGKDVLHPDATFEVLKDGSTALVLQSGYRLKLNLSDLLEGGDATREARLKTAEKEKKKKSKYSSEFSGMFGPSVGGGWGDYDKDFKYSAFKQYINQYTISMDIKLLEDPPREGLALFQTALIHSKENKRSGKTTLSRSDGECLINQAGGVGIFGTYGDTSRAAVKTGGWKRVVIAVNCVEDANAKGELRTWVGTEPGVILKEDAFNANDRFAIDPASFFLFSSANPAMMPGNIAIRTVRIDQVFFNDGDVKSNRARDKVC